MYDKITSFAIIDSHVCPNDLIKMAAVGDIPEPYDPEFLYTWVRSISAGEYFGSNKNADYFPEKEIVGGHQTFLDAHVFKNHDNKDVANAIGSVIKTIWNPVMKCVELLIKIDRQLAPTIVRGFEKGTATDVSMGCRVSHTICSYCGNVAKTRAEFCQHVKTMRNQIMPDGKKVFEYNIGPKFHDISIVLNGADRTAKVLEIVAADDVGFEKAASTLILPEPNDPIPTVPIALSSPNSLNKRADIQKEIVDKLHTLAIVNRNGEPLSEEVLDELMMLCREAGIALAFGLEKKAGTFRDIKNIAIGSTGIALATNYLQGKRLRGEKTSKVQDFIADNPGVLPIAYALVGYPAYKHVKRRINILKAASVDPDTLGEDFTQFFSKEASDLSLSANLDTCVDIFNNPVINERLTKVANTNARGCSIIKSAAINYGAGREDLVNIAKETYHITDNDIGNFLKISYDVIVEDLEKEARLVRGLVEAQLMNPTTTRGLPTGLGAPVILGSILDGYIFSKLFAQDDKSPKETK